MDAPETEGTIRRRKSLTFRIAKFFVPKFFFVMSYVIFGTARVYHHNKHYFDEYVANQKSIIFACFHYTIIYLPFLLRHKRYQNTIGMVSTSPEGDYIAKTMNMFGHSVARGSSTRGGKTALRTMIDMINEGEKIGKEMNHGLITVDGPKGPAYVAKMGIIKFGKETGLPIVPSSWYAKPCFRFKNWDQTMISFPFSKIVVTYEEAMFVPADADEEQMEELRKELTRRLVLSYDKAKEICLNGKEKECTR